MHIYLIHVFIYYMYCVFLEPTFFFHTNAFKGEVNP